MAGFQHSQLLNFFDQANANLVSQLSVRFGFDESEALSFLKGVQSDATPATTPKGKKAKAAKDPNAPKKAPTAFFLFSALFREEQKDSLQGVKASEVAKLAGARWREIKETDDALEFHTEAARLKELRAEEVARYEATKSEAAPQTLYDAVHGCFIVDVQLCR